MAAAGAKREVGSAEVYFAKKLANNDKKIRDRSVKRLKIWISSKVKSGTGKGWSCILVFNYHSDSNQVSLLIMMSPYTDFISNS